MRRFQYYAWGSNQHGQCIGAALSSSEQFDRPSLVDVCLPASSADEGATRGTADEYSILCGGGHSGILTLSGMLYLWGWNDEGQCYNPEAVNTDTILEGSFKSSFDQQVRQASVRVIEGVAGAALGHSTTLLLLKDGSVRMLGRFPRGARDKLTAPPFQLHVRGRAKQVAIGLKHASFVTEDGFLYSWGDNSFGQCPGVDELKSRYVHVACGARSTTVIDSDGKLHSAGSSRHGALGRLDGKSTLSEVVVDTSGDDRVQWRSISMGWSHVVAQGVRERDGVTVFYCWGRRDLGQLLIEEAEAAEQHQDEHFLRSCITTPRRVRHPGELLRTDHIFLKTNFERSNILFSGESELVEIHCGSEFCVAKDSRGQIFACGWNEHGNLGTGDSANSMGDWRLVYPLETSRSEAGYHSSTIACGGAHCLLAHAYANTARLGVNP